MFSEIDKLFDENNHDPIILYNQKGEQISFEQIAIIPIKECVYAILKPIIPFEGTDPDEGFVFEIKEIDNEEVIVLVTDEKIIDDVFDVYFKLVEEE